MIPLSLRVPFCFYCVHAFSIPGGKGSTVISVCTTGNPETEDVRTGFSEVTGNSELRIWDMLLERALPAEVRLAALACIQFSCP